MKRLIPIALIAPLAVAACSSSKTSTTSPTTATSATSATTATTGGSSATSVAGGDAAMNTANPGTAVNLTEAGSSLLYPYLQLLVGPLHSQYSNVTLAVAPGGSGKGITDAISGATDMGGSDAYLSASRLSANPGLLNVPIAVSAQAVNYNLKGVTNLKLSGDVIAQMYEGKITKWNDPAIAALNPGTNLPSTAVVPVRRVDSSGDTFLFSSFLSATNSAWSNGPSMGTTISWPSVSTEETANGNPGMVQTCSAAPGCIAYVGISAENAAQAAGLGEAQLKNKDGSFVLPDASTVTAAVAAGSASVPSNLAASLIYEPGASSYPIVNFEYIVVKSKQVSTDKAQAIRDFLAFAIDPSGGASSTNLAKEHFQALPSSVISAVKSAIASVQ